MEEYVSVVLAEDGNLQKYVDHQPVPDQYVSVFLVGYVRHGKDDVETTDQDVYLPHHREQFSFCPIMHNLSVQSFYRSEFSPCESFVRKRES